MNKTQLGRTDLQITPIGFGAWAVGGEWRFGWGPQDDDQSIAAIRRAVELGINWVDTAAVYGLGHSEEVVAQALEGFSANDRPYVFTKCSLVWNEDRVVRHSLNPASIRKEVDASLARLGVEAIDLYQIHWPEWPASDTDANPGSIEEAWTMLAALQQDGKLRHIGVSNFNAAQLARAEVIAPVASNQPPYSLLRREIEESVLPWCLAHQAGVIVYSPMQSGLLSGSMTRERIAALPEGDWRRNNPRFKEPELSRNLAIVEKLRDIGARHEKSPGEVAIAWTLRQPAVTGAIVGARSAAQVDGFIGAADFRLSPSEIDEIETAVTNVQHA
jgi:aryl-alcohol dehydrogenase-like predicted oxidoreductase